MTALELYAAIEAKGSLLDGNGLCNDVAHYMDGFDCLEHAYMHDSPNTMFLSQFKPTDEDEERYGTKEMCYWGADDWDDYATWSPLRQTLLLFLAAERGEL